MDASRSDLAALALRLEAPLSKYVLGFVRDRATAEDIVQDAFLRALRHLPRFRGRASLKTWIFSIARNLCLDHLRAAGRARLRVLEPPDLSSPDPVQQLDLDERRARVGRALAALPSQARDLLILRVYLGLSYREIARQCRVPPQGVGVRISRALEGLSRRLA